MPDREFECDLFYRAAEEVLTTSPLYVIDTGVEEDDDCVVGCREIADRLRTTFLAAGANALAEFAYWMGVRVRTGVYLAKGPAFYSHVLNVDGADDFGPVVSDQITYRVNLRGRTELGDPVNNYLVMSGLPTSAIDCNTLQQAAFDELTDSWRNMLPLQFATTIGLAVLSVRANRGGGVFTLHPVETIAISGVVGSSITRRGNRSQGHSGAAALPPANPPA